MNQEGMFVIRREWSEGLMGLSLRRVVQGAVLAVALGLCLLMIQGIWKGKKQKDQQQAVTVREPGDAEMKLTDMEYTEMQEGRKFWTLRASEAKYFQSEQKTLLSAVQLIFYLEEGDEIRLESREGSLHAGTKDIELWNAVRVILPRGYKISTERAFYEQQKQSIFSDVMVRLDGPDVLLEGNRWEYRIPEHRAILDGGVRASMSLKPATGKPTK
ncbi:MAG: LPS export ABC transporter periplasmic protein LptC [Deltaproteobacteria bacterium]|nr:LPS export ABC transporter periplasmic protein LptC [Deltaproteobacteria bacterium]